MQGKEETQDILIRGEGLKDQIASVHINNTHPIPIDSESAGRTQTNILRFESFGKYLRLGRG